MKNLTLIRHAEASSPEANTPDKTRNLTQKGKEQVKKIANRLKKRHYFPEIVLCSPAKRTTQTATLLCQELEIDPNIIKIHPPLYSDNLREILNYLCLASTTYLLLIGHNPTLSGLAHTLCTATQAIFLPLAGVLSIDFPIQSWEDLLLSDGTLSFFIAP